MKVVRVQYTLKPGHVAANQQNIAAVVAELKALNHPGIKYGAWLLPDGKSFMHFDQFTDEAAHLTLQELPSLKNLPPNCGPRVSTRNRCWSYYRLLPLQSAIFRGRIDLGCHPVHETPFLQS